MARLYELVEATHARLRAGFERVEARVAAWPPPVKPPMPALPCPLPPEGDGDTAGAWPPQPARPTARDLSPALSLTLPQPDTPVGNGAASAAPDTRNGGGFDEGSSGGGQAVAGAEMPFPGFSVPAAAPEPARNGPGSLAHVGAGSPVGARGLPPSAAADTNSHGSPPRAGLGSLLRRPHSLLVPGAPPDDSTCAVGGGGAGAARGVPGEVDVIFAEALVCAKGGQGQG